VNLFFVKNINIIGFIIYHSRKY